MADKKTAIETADERQAREEALLPKRLAAFKKVLDAFDGLPDPERRILLKSVASFYGYSTEYL